MSNASRKIDLSRILVHGKELEDHPGMTLSVTRAMDEDALEVTVTQERYARMMVPMNTIAAHRNGDVAIDRVVNELVQKLKAQR
jgi:hypothetical protein